MASTFTPNLSLEIPAHGDYASTGWDNPMDNSLRSLDTAYGGYLSLAVTGGTTTLTIAQAANPIIYLSGTLSSDLYLNFPPIAGRRLVIPNVTLGSFNVYVRGNNGADTVGVYFWSGFGIPYPVIVTPTRVYWDYGGTQPGLIATMPLSFPGNGWLPCDGRAVNMGLHDLLWNTIGASYGSSGSFPTGTFNLPDMRGTVAAMADQIGAVPPSPSPFSVNRGNRGIMNSYGFTTTSYVGEANHTLAVAEMPSHAHPGTHDSGHTHSDSGHAHSYTMATNFALYGGQYPSTGAVSQAAATTGVAAANIQAAAANIVVSAQGGSGAHNNIQPSVTMMKMIRW